MQQIKFNHKTEYRGRNGYGKMTGIEIWLTDNEKNVRLSPVNSKGPTDACVLKIKDLDIGEFIEGIGKELRQKQTNESQYAKWLKGDYRPGSFVERLFEAYAKADSSNTARLVAAFPELFV